MARIDEAILTTIRQPLLILNGKLQVCKANPAFYASFDVAAADTLGRFVYELGNGQWDIPRLRSLLEDVLPNNFAVEDYEVEHDFPRIGTKHMIVNARRLEQTGASEELIFIAIDDVTAEREAKRSLEAYARELERSNRDLEQFAYVASHDLQEPLRTVSSFASLLERRYGAQLDEKAKQYIDFMTDAAQRMQRLIKDLLAFSRITRDDAAFEHTALDELLREASLRLAESIEETDARITHDDLPSLYVQPHLIVQLFQNLVANAIKYRSAAPPEVHVTSSALDGGWRIDVRDNGAGIEAEYHERIFGLFQRLHAGSHSEGTGIGLALCRRIVEHHDGTIWVTSSPGEGATFSFTLKGSTP